MVRNDIRGSLGSSKQFLMLGRVLFSLRTSFLCVKFERTTLVWFIFTQLENKPELTLWCRSIADAGQDAS